MISKNEFYFLKLNTSAYKCIYVPTNSTPSFPLLFQHWLFFLWKNKKFLKWLWAEKYMAVYPQALYTFIQYVRRHQCLQQWRPHQKKSTSNLSSASLNILQSNQSSDFLLHTLYIPIWIHFLGLNLPLVLFRISLYYGYKINYFFKLPLFRSFQKWSAFP